MFKENLVSVHRVWQPGGVSLQLNHSDHTESGCQGGGFPGNQETTKLRP